MRIKKSRRWQYIILSSFFLVLELLGMLSAAKPALADCTTNLSGYWKISETISFSTSLLNGSDPPKFDTITGDKALVANEVGSPTHKGNGVTVTYQTTVQNDQHGCNVPPQQFKETSTLLNKSATCIAASVNKSAPSICNINGDATTTDPGSGGGGNTKTQPSCETAGGGPLDWLICAAFDTLSSVSNAIFDSLIIPLLRQPPIPLSDSGNNKAIFEIWSNFRVYADIFLVIALVVVVFMQAISGGTSEVYTAKKALPKLLAAAILINLSIYIVAIMVDVTNVVGAGIAQIVTAPLANSGNLALKPGVGSGALFTAGTLISSTAIITALYGGALGTAVAALPFIALNVILPLVVGLIIAFLVLALRQALIILLVLVSPIAFALWFLPNTEKAFNRWWSLFFEVLMVYPIAVLIFTIFNVVAVIIGGQGSILGPIGPLIAVVIMGISLFGFLLAFRFAGQTVGKIHETITQHGNRFKEAVKGNPNDQYSMRNRYRTKALAGLNTARENRYGVLNRKSLAEDSNGNPRSRFQRRFYGGLARAVNVGNMESTSSRQIEEADKIVSQQYSHGPDNFLRSFWARRYTGSQEDRDYFGADSQGRVMRTGADGQEYVAQTLRQGAWYSPYEDKEGHRKEWAASDVAKSYAIANRDPAYVQAMGKYEFTKAAQDDHIDSFKTRLTDQMNSGGVRQWGTDSGQKVWAGISFSQKPIRLEQRYTTLSGDHPGEMHFDDHRKGQTLDAAGNAQPVQRMEYGAVQGRGFARELADVVKSNDSAFYRSSTAKAAKERYLESKARIQTYGQDLAAARGVTDANKREAEVRKVQQRMADDQQTVRDFVTVARDYQSKARMYAPQQGLPEDEASVRGGIMYGSPNANEAWKDFINTVERHDPSSPPSATPPRVPSGTGSPR